MQLQTEMKSRMKSVEVARRRKHKPSQQKEKLERMLVVEKLFGMPHIEGVSDE